MAKNYANNWQEFEYAETFVPMKPKKAKVQKMSKQDFMHAHKKRMDAQKYHAFLKIADRCYSKYLKGEYDL